MEPWQISIISVIVPLVLIVFGLLTRFGLPQKVNWWMGYRTSMACKNQETWMFAHKHAGRLWITLGFVLLVLSVGATMFINSAVSPWFAGAISFAQLVALLLSLIPTEIALRKAFDSNGERRR